MRNHGSVRLGGIEEMVGGAKRYHPPDEKRNASLGFSHGEEQFSARAKWR
jgi:hypothetical protein